MVFHLACWYFMVFHLAMLVFHGISWVFHGISPSHVGISWVFHGISPSHVFFWKFFEVRSIIEPWLHGRREMSGRPRHAGARTARIPGTKAKVDPRAISIARSGSLQ